MVVCDLFAATDGSGGTPEYTHEELICVLQDELMLEVIMLLAQDIEARENKSLNLVIMEILFHLTERQDPRKVAKYMNNAAVDKTDQKSMDITAPTASNSKLHKQEKMVPRGSSIGLKQQLLIEKAQRNKALQSRSRHSHFGGVLLLDSVAMGKTKDGSGQRSVTTLYQNDPMAAMKKPSMRRDRKRLPFNARNNGNVKQKKFSQIGQRAEMALGKFCDGFFSEAYQLFMNNIKGEFRRESSRLSPDEDRVVFFRLTRFFLMTRRYSRANSYSSIAVKQVPSTQTNDNSDNNGLDAGSSASSSSSQSMKPSVDTGIVDSSMDLFSFNLVFTAVDEMVAEKKYAGLEYACELLLEMTHMLWHMRSNSTELGGGLRRIALGLMTQIFFGADPKDKLHFLFRSWQPATFTKQFLANLIELGYMTFKVLELRSRSDDLIIDKHIEAELKVASIFDMYSYVKKIATADVIETHRILLECFATNEPRQNHFCVSFFRRLCTTQLREHDENDSENAEFRPNGASKSVDSNKKVRGDFMATFEPLLYNIPILSLCEKVLNSPCVMGIETRVVFAELRMFCETVVRHFAKLAKSNPVLFVDALFTQPALQRIKFCESAHLHYVDAEQLVALKAQRRTDRGSTDDNIAMDNFDLQVEAEKLLSSFMQKESTMRTRASMSPTKGALGGELDDSDAENTLQRDEQALATSSSSSSSSSSGIVDSKVRVLEEEEEEEGFDLEDEALAAAAPKKKRKKVRKEGARGSKWTEDDDALLRVEHKKYRDSASMLEILCELEYFKAKGRTKGQIEKRIRTLKLHFAYEEDNEDQESDMEESAEEDDKSLNQDSEVEDMDEEASGTSDNTQLQNDEVLADGEAASSEKQTVTPDKITLSTETSSTVTPEHVENQAETNDLANETNPVLSTSDELIADERDGSSALTAMDVNDGVEAHFDKIDEVEDAEDMEPLNLLTKRKFKKSRKGKRIIKKMKPSGEIVGGASAPSLASELVDSEED